MKISRTSRLYRWAYLFGDEYDINGMGHRYVQVTNTTTCALWWRVLVWTPIQLVLTVVSAPFWVPLWAAFRYGPELKASVCRPVEFSDD